MNYFDIGNIKIKKTAALAPMAGVADSAFRILAKKYGASYMVGEMASTKGLVYNDRKTEALLKTTEEEFPTAIQLFGSEPYYISKAIEIASLYNPVIIDINSGCPVPKIAGNASGAALMRSPKLFEEVITAAVKSTNIPITVKIRSGWDFENINAVEIAKIAEACGVKAVTVHPRTRVQMYSGNADWNIISEVKNALKIPVIGNGDVVCVRDCIDMYEKTKCDLVMIGRGSYGRPWIFRQIKNYIENGILEAEPELEEKLEVLKSHVELMIDNDGERLGMKKARKHTAWYIKGIRDAAKYRNDCGRLTYYEDLIKLIKNILNENG